MTSVSIFYSFTRAVWLSSSAFFAIAGLNQFLYFYRRVKNTAQLRAFIPIILFGVGYILMAIASLLIGYHSGNFIGYDLVRRVVFILLTTLATVLTLSGLIIVGRGKYYGIPIALYVIMVLSVLLSSYIGLNILTFLVVGIMLFILIPVLVLGYAFVSTKRFAPLGYALSLLFIILLVLSLHFQAMIILFLGALYLPPSTVLLTDLLLLLSAAFASAASFFSTEKSKAAALTYAFTFIFMIFGLSLYLAGIYAISIPTQASILSWILSGLLAFTSAGYLSGRYFKDRRIPTLTLASFFYAVGYYGLITIVGDVNYFLELGLDINLIIALKLILIFGATIALLMTFVSLLGRTNYNTWLLVVWVAVAIYFLSNPTQILGFSVIFVEFSAAALLAPVFLFGLLAASIREMSVAKVRALSLFLGSLFFSFSIVPSLAIFVNTIVPGAFVLSEFLITMNNYFVFQVLLILSMTIYVLGITGRLARFFVKPK
ncbi:MAG: hypothetical protein J7L47_01600 [Candidatus Odinarchaeota archaeon]|nr:hypothetical protein [Candidatus Odinarchaeota archaeon]